MSGRQTRADLLRSILGMLPRRIPSTIYTQVTRQLRALPVRSGTMTSNKGEMGRSGYSVTTRTVAADNMRKI